jgi:hypothetical protein
LYAATLRRITSAARCPKLARVSTPRKAAVAANGRDDIYFDTRPEADVSAGVYNARMKRTLKAISISVAGVVIVVAAFIYDTVFAGLPYQDPTQKCTFIYDTVFAGLPYQDPTQKCRIYGNSSASLRIFSTLQEFVLP